uniref:TFA2 Winged helix domain-containing protein n=1 Tax=Attheya septentrionalis TaxID=420275 RepID=A0A7S2U8X2_9STRA|mmetsp:Transcript_15492/g.28130  ORF Transcript_15492/g.28130 Transcript_15492/m.28130 type:complete len:598 (+) Transcript_15492:139-1932(+)
MAGNNKSANSYGFDFLRSEHVLSSGSGPGNALPGVSSLDQLQQQQSPVKRVAPESVAHKSDLEKQFDVIHFLQAHRASGCLSPSIILRSTGIDLSTEGKDASVAKMLLGNPKIRIDDIPDPENPSLLLRTYGYQAKFNHVHNKVGLLAQINRSINGVAVRDLNDAYDDVDRDLNALVTAGDVVALDNPEDKSKILFPRGEPFLVELDGHITLPSFPQTEADLDSQSTSDSESDNDNDNNNNTSNNDTGTTAHNKKKVAMDPVVKAAIKKAKAAKKLQHFKEQRANHSVIVETDADPTKQIRRGEAVCVGGQWFRISSAIREGVPLSEQPARAHAPPSVTLRKDLSNRNDPEYIRKIDATHIPLDAPLSSQALANLKDAKEARERLHKIAGSGGGRGVSGGAAAQLLSSTASAANPSTLAAAFSSAVGAHHMPSGGGMSHRKRPTASTVANKASLAANHHPNAAHQLHKQKQLEAMEAAKKAALDPALRYSHGLRHGCTKDVRDMYLATREDVPENENELYSLLLKHKLVEPSEAKRRPRLKKKLNLDNDGKPKKRRYYTHKNQRMTNTHLIGTEIGAALARAAEKQQQGRSVGDGGM